jgi:aspartyl-tRNA(Asn)/glutamyl-tRNA(Gln) amidotransferase subunit C
MLTPEEVRHVAMLARLGLSDEEVETMRGQLEQVLDYINMLEKLDTSAIPPTAQILSHLNVTREDKSRPSWPPSELLANAPASEDGFFRVPAVLEEFKEGANG